MRFTFPTSHPIYPFHPAPTDLGPRQLDLFVFGPGRASTSGLHSRRCSKPRSSNTHVPHHPTLRGGALRLRHPDLHALAETSPYATWLHGTLAPDPARPDLRIHWTDRELRGEKLYSRSAAWQLTANVIGFSLAGCTLILIGVKRRLPPGQSLQPLFSRLLFAILGIGLLTYAMTPKLDPDRVTSRRISDTLAREQSDHVAHALQAALEPHPSSTAAAAAAPDAAADFLQEHFAQVVHHHLPPHLTLNLYTGEPLRLEASPGHFTLEPHPAGLNLHWHDFDGVAALPTALTLPPRPSSPTDPGDAVPRP